ncbi:hypothetical protein LIER_40822 [Lithospermum erythrorhizon]|uniref:Uncharacterized protein n=1 Tax=Lithospermum erythrorhizon TaxID=34254 RepID=A0AAV3R3T8_LITER
MAKALLDFRVLKGYSDWLDSVFFAESIRSAPLGPGKGKSAPRLPNPVIPSVSKPLKKRSLPEDDSVDRDPKHAKWGSARRPDPVVVPSPNAPIVATPDEAPAEAMDTEEPSDWMVTEVADDDVLAASSFAGVQRIKSIFRDSLMVAWAELCSLVDHRSYEVLLTEEEGMMDSFQTLKRFSGQDLLSQDEEVEAVLSKARHLKDARGSVVPLEIHDRLAASEERAACLRQELTELVIHEEGLRRQVTVRESVITGLEAEQAEFALKAASLEESIKKGRESCVEQLGIELMSLCFPSSSYNVSSYVKRCIPKSMTSSRVLLVCGVTSYMNSAFRLWMLTGSIDGSDGTSSSVMFTRNEKSTLSSGSSRFPDAFGLCRACLHVFFWWQCGSSYLLLLTSHSLWKTDMCWV